MLCNILFCRFFAIATYCTLNEVNKLNVSAMAVQLLQSDNRRASPALLKKTGRSATSTSKSADFIHNLLLMITDSGVAEL